MTRIVNTSKSRRNDWLFGGNPHAIEDQEAEGQAQLAASSQLPAQINRKTPEETIAFYFSLGITSIQLTPDDDVFLDVSLPPGWKISPTEHPMWSELLNEAGVEVGSIFYKAAFYDRRAFFRVAREEE